MNHDRGSTPDCFWYLDKEIPQESELVELLVISLGTESTSLVPFFISRPQVCFWSNKKSPHFLPDCNIYQALVILPFMQTGSQFSSFKFSSSALASRWEMSRRRVVHLRIPHTALNTRIPRLAAVHSRCPHTARGLQVKQVADRCRVFLEAWMRCRLMYSSRRGRAGRCFISTWPISQAKVLIN